MDNYITRQEYEEHNKRMDDEHKRQNHRIGLLEKISEQNNKLLISVEKLALNMETMQKELKKQGESLEAQSEEIEQLKGRDGEKWRRIKDKLIDLILGAVVGFLIAGIIWAAVQAF